MCPGCRESDLGIEDKVSILRIGFSHPMPEKR
jgi:hypothetical protein